MWLPELRMGPLVALLKAVENDLRRPGKRASNPESVVTDRIQSRRHDPVKGLSNKCNLHCVISQFKVTPFTVLRRQPDSITAPLPISCQGQLFTWRSFTTLRSPNW